MKLAVVLLSCVAATYGFNFNSFSAFAPFAMEEDTDEGNPDSKMVMSTGSDKGSTTGPAEITGSDSSGGEGATTYQAACCCNAMASASAETLACVSTSTSAMANISVSARAALRQEATAVSSASANADAVSMAAANAKATAEIFVKVFVAAQAMANAMVDLLETRGDKDAANSAIARAEEAAAAMASAKAKAEAAASAAAAAAAAARAAEDDLDEAHALHEDSAEIRLMAMQTVDSETSVSAEALAVAVNEESHCGAKVEPSDSSKDIFSNGDFNNIFGVPIDESK